jgi:adenosylcobinamide kinase/adenosylcobinamide-phosphate guanylyltransferase
MSRNIDFPCVTLILGGARSGKSRYAENLLGNFEHLIYLATAEASHADDQDGEMAARITEHIKRRGPQWQTVEEPIDIISVLSAHSKAPILVDCMTMWLANIMSVGLNIEAEIDALANYLKGLSGPIVLVSNEVGQGIVPDNALARTYMDGTGRMNQSLAACADQVVVMHAGLPQILKDN